MARHVAVMVGVFLAFAVTSGLTTEECYAQKTVVVQLKPPGNSGGDPFPIGWATLNLAQGEVTLLAILPADTVIPGSGENDPNAGRWVFEGWIADLAPPHRCGDGTVDEPTNEEDFFNTADPTVADETPEVPICGSRVSSETKFRGFPGIPNRNFAKTYFPVSQGLLRKVGPNLGDWALYMGRHKINMGLRPYDVVGITVEPPGTGSRIRDYDPRPNPVVALIGRIPHPELAPPGEGNGDPNEDPSQTREEIRRRRAASALSER